MEKTVPLGEVDYIDSDRVDKLCCILHAKVEPLEATDAIGVIAHPHVERGG